VTKEQREEIERLDRWLAVAEVTGRRFQVGWGVQCAIVSYSKEQGVPAESYGAFCFRLFSGGHAFTLYQANDRNDGDPGAVRAELHRLYPFLVSLPQPETVNT
jgi:hypothetical protein